MRIRRVSCVFLAVCLAGLGAANLGAQGSGEGQEQEFDNPLQGPPADANGGMLQRGVSSSIFKARQISGGNLIDHGGRVLPASDTYLIWWGTQSAFPADAVAGITGLLQGLNGSSFLGIAHQYMRGASMSSTFKASATDTSAPPSRSPSTSAIVNEACRMINSQGWTVDPKALYIVVTSNFPSRVNYCAWHSAGTCNGQTIQVSYEPNTTGIGGCDPGNQYSCNTHSQGTRSLANVLTHEFMEAVTDADINAWYDSAGSEIGDKCAWQFQSCVPLSTGSWQLQMEWSNAISACQQK